VGARRFPILASQRLAPTVTRFEIEAPLVARKREAGHFVMIRVAEDGERIPLTIVDSDPESGSITLIVQAVGKTTRLLATKRAGDVLIDVVGPLGNPTPLANYGTVACVGGGVGSAELLPIARALCQAGNRVHAILGARSRDLLILEEEMAACSESLTVTTDDGSHGRHGVVTGPLQELLDGAHATGNGSARIGAVYAIGPLPMMKAVAAVTRPYGVKTIVSLNAIMVDGTGMCGGCRVSVAGQMKFACVDGPEFDGHDVDFDELIRRNRTYHDMERLANELYSAGQPA
jgi:ferredoxin--NADP+ reductase